MKWLLVLKVLGAVVMQQGPFMDLEECQRWKIAATAQLEQRAASGVPIPKFQGRTITKSDVEIECAPVGHSPVRP